MPSLVARFGSPLALVGALAFPRVCVAQTAATAQPAAAPEAGLDRVILRSGTTVEGRVRDQKEGEFVVIRATDGTTRTIAWANVEQVVLADDGTGGDDTTTTFGKHSLTVEGTFKNAEAKRQAWLKAGGALVSYDVRLNATGILLPKQSFPSPISVGAPCETANGQFATQGAPNGNGDPGRSGGGGGGVGGRIGLLYFKPPSPTAASFSGWWGFHAVTGADFSAMGLSLATGLQQTPAPPRCATGLQPTRMGTGFYSVAVPLDLGINIGLGGFGDASSWSGLVLGISYAPSYQVSGGFSGGSPSGNFNAAGFELNFDVTSLRATMARYAERAHFRFTAFLLPPIGDLPLLGTLAFGAVWY